LRNTGYETSKVCDNSILGRLLVQFPCFFTGPAHSRTWVFTNRKSRNAPKFLPINKEPSVTRVANGRTKNCIVQNSSIIEGWRRCYILRHSVYLVEVLLQGLEEQLDLPALFVDGGNRGGAEFQQIREQDDFPPVVGIPNHDAAQRAGTVRLGLDAGEKNDLVGTNIAILRDRGFRFNGKSGIVFETGIRVRFPSRS